MKRELNIMILIVSVWLAGIAAAPLLSGTPASELLYRFYSFVCHQFDSRSFHLNDHPFAVCIRCTSIYTAFFITLLTVRFFPRLRAKEWNTPRVALWTGFPIAADGLFTLMNFTEATTLSRIITGSLFGTGLALLLHTLLSETLRSIIAGHFKTYESETR